jgi:hypothetical protein
VRVEITPDGARLDGVPLAALGPPGELVRLGSWSVAVLDTWLPEAARLMQLRGADLLAFLPRAAGSDWERLAGPWQLVQQTQCYGVDGGVEVLAPCEITPGETGKLGRVAELDLAALRALRARYDLRRYLRPDVYLRQMPW